MNGTQQALDLMMRVIFARGDAIAMEYTGYLSARRIFTSRLTILGEKAGIHLMAKEK